jgi:capsular exopolysaccharide synthesis family protein
MAEPPKRPVSPNTSADLTRGFIGALALAIGLVFLVEYLDNRINTPAEMKDHLRLPFLGMVPALFGQDAKKPLISKAVAPGFIESFGTVRTNVLFSSVHEGTRSIAVTSTGPGEGKTVVAGNLAIALAQSGLRVLLVDGDMRKPRVHETFGVPAQPGLSNVLVGTAKASHAVRGSGVPGLWLLPAGLLPPKPAELLGSKRFRDLLASFALDFDWVVVDTPPVLAVTDSSVIAHLVTGVVFVVGAEMTSRHAAQRALEQLERAHAKFIGAVLNRVDLKHNAYYYSQYYRHQYSSYYQSAS